MRVALLYLLLKWYSGGVDQGERFKVVDHSGRALYWQVDDVGDEHTWDPYVWWAGFYNAPRRAWYGARRALARRGTVPR